MIRRLGHLALWPALYAAGVLVLAQSFFVGGTPFWPAIGFVVFTSHACYLLDRVKISDSRFDPADEDAQPDRYRFLTRHAPILRRVILLDLLLAITLGVLISLALVPVPILACAGVHMYAGRRPDPQRPRVKDFPAFKAVFIAGGHIALAIVTIMAELGFRFVQHEIVDGLPILAIWMIVFADAILCDLDDRDADQRFRTLSLPVLLGNRTAWWIAICAHVVGIATLGYTHGVGIAWITLCAMLIVTDGLFVLFRHQRDAVDARLLPIAILVVALKGI